MRTRRRGLFVAMAAVVGLALAAPLAHAAKAGRPAARGRVSMLNTSARTFVVTNRKTGETTVSYDDKTAFKRAAEEPGGAPSDASAGDLRDRMRVIVRGTLDAGKVHATEITIGAHRRKPPAAAAAPAPAK